jgi:hypothetical protein
MRVMRVVRIMRVLRVLRVMKIGAVSRTMQMLTIIVFALCRRHLCGKARLPRLTLRRGGGEGSVEF